LTESQFIEQNQKQWKELEVLLDRQIRDADRLHTLFVKVSSDLSFARTFYPNRSVRLYLNNLTQRVLDSMRTTEEKFSFKKIQYFFTHILPYEIYRSRKAFLVSLSVFVVAVLIGIVSSAYNPEFPSIILGQDYIDITNENINKGDPMAIYKDEDKTSMFLGITTNNIRVAFLAFVLGLLGSIGTIIVLLSNGIMVGAFQYFFYSKGLFLTSFLTIWIHGTIEISAIIIAGAAGIILGNGILFPDTYKRSTALQTSAMRALRILLGTVPLFLIAGLLESFVTRQTEYPTFVKAGIIIFSLFLILFMFVIYPWYYNRSDKTEHLSFDIIPNHTEESTVNKYSYKSLGEIISSTLLEFRMYFSKNVTSFLFPTFVILAFTLWIYVNLNYNDEISVFDELSYFRLEHGSLLLLTLIWLLISFCLCMLKMSISKIEFKLINTLKFLKQYYIKIAFVTLFLVAPYMIIPDSYYWLLYLLIPPHFCIALIERITTPEDWEGKSITDIYSQSILKWPNYFIQYTIIIIIIYIGYAFISSPVSQYESASDLKLKFESFGKDSNVFEKI